MLTRSRTSSLCTLAHPLPASPPLCVILALPLLSMLLVCGHIHGRWHHRMCIHSPAFVEVTSYIFHQDTSAACGAGAEKVLRGWHRPACMPQKPVRNDPACKAAPWPEQHCCETCPRSPAMLQLLCTCLAAEGGSRAPQAVRPLSGLCSGVARTSGAGLCFLPAPG